MPIFSVAHDTTAARVCQQLFPNSKLPSFVIYSIFLPTTVGKIWFSIKNRKLFSISDVIVCAAKSHCDRLFYAFFKLITQLKLRYSRSISALVKQSQKMKMGPQSSKFWSLWRFILDGRVKVLLEIRENYKICSCNVLQSNRHYTSECCVSKSWERSKWSSRRRWWLTIFSEDNKQQCSKTDWKPPKRTITRYFYGHFFAASGILSQQLNPPHPAWHRSSLVYSSYPAQKLYVLSSFLCVLLL